MRGLLLIVSLMAFIATAAVAASDFVKIDADGDGSLTIDELRAAGLPWSDEEFAAADADKDGMLSEAELNVATQ